MDAIQQAIDHVIALRKMLKPTGIVRVNECTAIVRVNPSTAITLVRD